MSRDETFSVFISYSSIEEQAEPRLSFVRRLFTRSRLDFVIFVCAECSRQPKQRLAIDSWVDSWKSRRDESGRPILVIGDRGCGKTTSLLSHLLSNRERSPHEDFFFRAITTPGATLPTAERFEWRRLDLITTNYDHSFQELIERVVTHTAGSTETAENDLFAWTPESREGFFWNRFLSYPQGDLLKFGEGVRGLGGLATAFRFAWDTIFEKIGLIGRNRTTAPSILEHRDKSILSWATALADWHGCEVVMDDERDLNGCLIETPGRRAIYISDHLELKTKWFTLLHELAHFVLGHRANTEYGLDPSLLSSDALWAFKRQERTADALASIFSYLIEGLDDIVLTLHRHRAGRHAQPRQPRLLRAAEDRCTGLSPERSEVHCNSP